MAKMKKTTAANGEYELTYHWIVSHDECGDRRLFVFQFPPEEGAIPQLVMRLFVFQFPPEEGAIPQLVMDIDPKSTDPEYYVQRELCDNLGKIVMASNTIYTTEAGD